MSYNAEAYDREMLNIGGKPDIMPAFRGELIDAMIAEPYTRERTVDQIFVTIDPSGGKDQSLYALLSTIFIDGICVVCHLFHSSCVCVFSRRSPKLVIVAPEGNRLFTERYLLLGSLQCIAGARTNRIDKLVRVLRVARSYTQVLK